MIKENLTLDERLMAAATLVPKNSVLLDVGTDHGYLPVYLIKCGRIQTAGASDVNSDPLSKAVRTAENYGVTDRMSFYLSDGFDAVFDLDRYNCISICGMGGELISRILSDFDHVRDEKVSLVLQPMSSVRELSEYLASEGFAIKDEKIAFAAGKLYRVILASYDGVVRSLTEVEHILGKINIDRGTAEPHFGELLLKNITKYKRICDGKKAGGIDFSDDTAVLAELTSIAEKEGVNYDNT